jgi:hypothetical protein
MDKFFVTILLIIVALFSTAAWQAERYARCGVPIGEQCGTDTECECLHGVDE